MKEENKTEFETEIDLEAGTIKLDIFKFLRELPDEKRDELLWDNGWWAFVYPHLLKELRQGFSRNNYNAPLNEFRLSLLTSDHAPQMIKEFVEAIVADTVGEIRYLRQWYDAYFKLYHCDHPDFHDGQVHEIINKYMPRDSNRGNAKTEWVAAFLNEMCARNGIEFPPTPDEFHIDG